MQPLHFDNIILSSFNNARHHRVSYRFQSSIIPGVVVVRIKLHRFKTPIDEELLPFTSAITVIWE